MFELARSLAIAAASLVATAHLPSPTVVGPRMTASATAAYRIVESGVARSRIHFQCGFDSPKLRPCASRLKIALAAGEHTLRVEAIVGQRRSPITAVSILRLSSVPVTRVAAGQAPVDIAFGFGSLWIVDLTSAGNVLRVDLASAKVIATIHAGGIPRSVTVAAGSVWVGNEQTPIVARIDPATDGVVATVGVHGEVFGFAFDGSALWAANLDGYLQRIDVTTNRVVETVADAGDPEFPLFAFGRLWVTNEDGTVTVVNPADGSGDGPAISVNRDVDGITADDNALFVVTYYAGTVAKIDPATRKIRWRRRLPSRLFGVQYGNGALWVTLQDRGLLERLDPATGHIDEIVRTGGSPGRMVDDANGHLWIVDQAGGVLRINEAAPPR